MSLSVVMRIPLGTIESFETDPSDPELRHDFLSFLYSLLSQRGHLGPMRKRAKLSVKPKKQNWPKDPSIDSGDEFRDLNKEKRA